MLDYIRRKGEPDRTPEQMRQDIDVFLRECRKEYRKAGLEYLRQQGYYTAVCYGWQPAAQLIEQYLLHSDELTKEQETVTMR